MKILFTGDINFRGKENLTGEECAKILSEMKPYLDQVDFRIPNLETPLAQKNKYEPIKKSGPNLICEAKNIIFLRVFQADGNETEIVLGGLNGLFFPPKLRNLPFI
jgi:hypothetical protein